MNIVILKIVTLKIVTLKIVNLKIVAKKIVQTKKKFEENEIKKTKIIVTLKKKYCY